MENKKPVITDRDLQADYDEQKFDRVGKPLGIEENDAGKPESEQLETQKTHTLQDLQKDYEFFTTGVIHAVTPFDRDPVTEFLRHNPDAAAPMIIDYAEPFFQGLGVCFVGKHPVDMDRRLYMITREYWAALRDFISGIAMTDPKNDYHGRINFYEMPLVDSFALKKMTVVDTLPEVTITVFGVSSNKNFGYLMARQYPAKPLLAVDPPKETGLTETIENLK